MFKKAFVLFGLLISVVGSVFADEIPKDLTAVEIQKLVRYSNAIQNQIMTGRLEDRKTQKVVPFTLSMQFSAVRFRFNNPAQIIHLDIKDESYLLREVVSGKNEVVPKERYEQSVRGTDICYEDLTMRFLYWPKPELIDEERVKTRKTWKLRIYNPTKVGPYHAVEIWVDQQSGAILKMQGYNYQGKMIKRFSVISGQKVNDAWILKEMRIESFKPGESRPLKQTYLMINRPTE